MGTTKRIFTPWPRCRKKWGLEAPLPALRHPPRHRRGPDVTLAVDTRRHAPVSGHCPGRRRAIKVMDSASISNYKLVDFMRDLAEKHGIKYQMEIPPRGGLMPAPWKGSIPAVLHHFVCAHQYVHSNGDHQQRRHPNTARLLARFLETAHTGDFSPKDSPGFPVSLWCRHTNFGVGIIYNKGNRLP